MVKMVLKDWIGGRKEAFLEAWKSGGYVLMIILIQGVTISGNMTGFKWQESIPLSCETSVMLVMLWLHYMYPNKLAKTMFFLPLEEKEKKRYLITGYFIKIVIVTLLHITVTGIIFALNKISAAGGAFVIASLLLCNISMGLYNGGKGETMENLILIISIFMYTVFLGIGKTPMELREKIVLLLCLGIQGFVCLYGVKKRFYRSIEKAVNYEMIYGMKEERKR